MNSALLSGRTSEALLRASEHRQSEKNQAAAPKKFAACTITLSRQAGAGGAAVAREVGTRLGWPVYDQELVERIAREMGLRAELLASVDERNRSFLLECVEAFASSSPVSGSAYVRHLVETVLSLGARGECIIVGRGAAQILPGPSTLRVRLIGDLEERIRSISREMHKTHDEAARLVQKIDQERKHFIRDHFQNDPTDPTQYDLLVNSSRFTPAECAVVIIEALKRLQARTR